MLEITFLHFFNSTSTVLCFRTIIVKAAELSTLFYLFIASNIVIATFNDVIAYRTFSSCRAALMATIKTGQTATFYIMDHHQTVNDSQCDHIFTMSHLCTWLSSLSRAPYSC